MLARARSLVLALAAPALALPAAANDRLYSVHVPAIAYEGANACPAGDVDGDGRPDVAVALDTDVAWISGRTGAVLRLVGLSSGSGHRVELASAGDVDQDGVPDVAFGRLGDRVELHSGATGQLVWTRSSPAFQYGYALASIGDVDGDGAPELVVGTPELEVSGGGDHVTLWTSGPGFAEVVSGRTGALLATIAGPGSDRGFGGSVCRVGDVDGDGVDDFAVAPWFRPAYLRGPYGGSGSVRVYSGATRAELFALSASTFTQRVAPIGDVDADGVPDLAVSTWPAAVRVVSGATQATLVEWTRAASVDTFGESIAAVGDLDGDGASELAIGTPAPPASGQGGTYDYGPGFVQVCSPRGGAVLFTLVGRASMGWFGATLLAPGDLDGDGVPDLAVGALGQEALIAYSGSTSNARPERFCLASPRSGEQAALSVAGTTHVANNDLELVVAGAQPNRAGHFFYAFDAAFEPFATTSSGLVWRCIGGPLFRAGRSVQTSGTGSARRHLDLSVPPAASGPGAIGSGTTIYAQFLYRDPTLPPPGLRTSDALAITFLP